ncbi:M-phase phosphoprotein 8 isoform X1 [Stigmatopora argus]
MATENVKTEPESEEENVYEVERIIDMRVEGGDVLYRVRWKGYCSDDDTWEPEGHLEDCREVLLTFKKAGLEVKKEAEEKKPLLQLPTKSDLFDADSESDSEKDRPADDAPVFKKKKKKKKAREQPLEDEDEEHTRKEKEKKKKKKRDKWRDEFKPLPAPETDEDEAEKTSEGKKRSMDSEDEDEIQHKKTKKDKSKEGKHKKDRGGEESKKKKVKYGVVSSDEDLSEGLSEEKTRPDEQQSKPKKKPDIKLKGIKDLIQDKKSKHRESGLTKVKAPAGSKVREDTGPPSSDSSDSSGLHRKAKSKSQEPAPAVKPPSSSADKPREDEAARVDPKGSTHLFEDFLLNCGAKDRAPRRPPEKSTGKPSKILGKLEKIIKPVKESPPSKEPEKTDRSKQPEAISRPGQSYGFSLDSDEREDEGASNKPRNADDSRERRDKTEENPSRPGWERMSRPDERKKRRDDVVSEDHVDQQPMEVADKGPATLNLGMDLNLDWMTLDDFQKHLNGDDEILSGPPLSPSELRDAVKSGDYVAVKLALNSKEEYNLDQEACTTMAVKRSFDERNPSDGIFIPHFINNPQEGPSASTDENLQKELESECSSAQRAETTKLEVDNFKLSSHVPEQTAVARDCGPPEGKLNSDQETNSLEFEEVTKDEGRTSRNCRRKPVEAQQPTRTSTRKRKKVVLTESSSDEGDKKVSKKHFCFYCHAPFSQLEKHLEKKHAEETDVAHAIHFPRGSKVRQNLLDQIRDSGDYEQRTKALRKNGGENFTQVEAKTTEICIRNFLPCQHCYTFYRKIDLWRHEESCKAKKSECESPELPNVDPVGESAASQSLPMSEFLTDGCREIIRTMHQDGIARHIVHDPLICEYGNTLLTKYNHDKSQYAYIGQKMRQLGRFMIAVSELDGSVRHLHQLCAPSRFELAVEGAKKASGFDPSCSRFKTFSLVSKIGYSLKRAAEIAFGESRMTEDRLMEGQVKAFIQLVDSKWSEHFSRRSLSSSSSSKTELPKAEVDSSGVMDDLIKLHRFIEEEGDEAMGELRHNPSVANWKKLSEATLADVCLFNRARVGNIGRLLLETYTAKKLRGHFVPSADQIKKCTKLELEVSGHFTRVELEGQFGRNMLVLLTEKMTLSLDLLVENRQNAGVSKSNPYLFPRTEGHSFIRGLDCFRRAAVECNVKNPEALLSPALREQIACCWQLMSLKQGELNQVAGLLGKSIQECYGLSQNASMLEDACKHLLQLDRTKPAIPVSTPRNGTSSKAVPKRRPWSEREQAAVKNQMSDFLKRMKVPGKKDCNACIAVEPDLAARSWTDVKNYVHNSIQTIRRRSHQHKEDRSCRASKPKRQTVEVQRPDLFDSMASCSISSGLQDLSGESANFCMQPQEPNPYTSEMPLSYTSLCSPSTNLIHGSQPLMSTFTSLNATDTQVVPTFTPQSTTSALMSSVYTSETDSFHPLASYSSNASSIHPSVYSDPLNSPILPNFSVPNTSLFPTFAPLNSPSPPLVSHFSTALSERSGMLVSSFAALDQSDTTSYPTDHARYSTTAQVVPTVKRGSVHKALPPPMKPKPSQKPSPSTSKPQKRQKRLWSSEEQAAVRRQFGDLGRLIKVPGKKECDTCLSAEPALCSRTWQEVKYFVHNNIQSMKRRGLATTMSELTEEPKQELETPASSAEWDGPVYLSL